MLASRLYRKPTFEFQTNVSLEIRPFEDDKIIQTLRRSNIYNQELATKLFKERPELVPIAKNPFAATLIADYAENNNNKSPANQSEMYRSYIEKTMHDCQDKLEKANIEIETIFTVCTVLAKEMFESYGLELPTNKIRLKYPEYPIDIVVDILRFARIGRGASNDTSKFSFVHRRFAEYFFVQNMLNGNVDVSLDSIPSDSQQRDALVLYCEVADFEKAKSIADYCWREIQRINNPMDLHSIHCLRFLRDAFRGRQECIKEFEDDLAGYLLNQFKENPNLVSAKISAELIGVLSEEKINTVLAQCLSINNTWVGENAIKSCRHIDKLDRNTTQMLSQYFTAINIVEIIKKIQ